MRRSRFAAVILLASSLAAHADTMSFTITFTAGLSTGKVTAQGTTDPLNSAAFDLTIASGSLNGLSLSLVPAGPGTNSGTSYTNPALGLFYDNVVYPSGGLLLDDAGLAFTDGINTYNPFYDAEGTYSGSVGYRLDTEINATEVNAYSPITVTITQNAVTPEPSSFALLGSGLLGIAGVVRKRYA